MYRIKIILFGLIFVFPTILFSQIEKKKEVVYLLFDSESKEKCKVEVEYSRDNDGNLDGYVKKNKFKKKFKRGKTIFNICDEKFLFDIKKQKTDTCTIQSLKRLNIKSIEYIKEKYQKGKDFKHHTFEQINIIERISNNQIVKYFNVYWSGEWTIE